jgi:hypothetical protein
MKQLACAADDCLARFDPYSIDQIYCSPQCAVRMRVRRCRARKRAGGGDDGGGGRQRRLFPKPVLAKPPKRVPEPVLFPDDAGGILLATFGGAVEYGQDSVCPIRDHTGYSVKRTRKPSASVPTGAKDAA